MPVSFCRFVSVGYFAGLLDPDYILGPIVECDYFTYLFHLSLRQRLALIFMKEHLRPSCALVP